MNLSKKLIALLLVVALFLQMLPLTVFAEQSGAAEPTKENIADTDTNEAAEAAFGSIETSGGASSNLVVGEMSERRTETEKHFRMSDGSYLAIDYGAPVHYTTDGGKSWADIDNTLTLSRSDAELYVSENGDSVRGFASDLRAGRLLAVSDGAYGLRFGLPETADNADGEKRNAATAEISYPDEKNRGIEELPFSEQITPSKLRTEVLYRNVYEGVDLSYVLYSYNVKESILINRPRDSYAFSFKLDVDTLKPVLIKDGSIELWNEDGKVIYLIPAPYMFDADGAESDAVSYRLEEAESGAWMLTVIADTEWINSKERSFPIAIDPTIYFAGNSTNQQIYSGYINDNSPDTHPSDSSSYIRCGNYVNSGATAGHSIGLIYVNKLPSIPENCVVTTSMLKLFQTYYSNDNDGYYNYPCLYTSQITDSSFNSNDAKTFIDSLTWYNITDKVTYGGGTTPETRTTIDYTKCKISTLGDHYFEITETTRKWYEGASDISRLLILDDGHTSYLNTRATFSGYGHNSFGHQPQLVVLYRNTIGVEGYYDYHTQNIGRAGTASVNNFTMGLSLSVPVYSAPSEALPFGITLTYNSPLSNANFTSSSSVHTKSYTTSATGCGWKTSVQQTVDRILLTGSDGTNRSWLIYTDADGTEHYFQRKGQTSDYEDEDGLGLTITVNNTSNPTTFTMKDKEKNTWTFLYGYLSSYEDNNGNALYYAYNGYDYSSSNSNWKPSDVSTVYRVTSIWRKNSGVSSATKLVTLSYANNRLSSIVDMASRTTSFSYDTDNNLSTISYPDGKTATYTYSNATVTDPQTGTTKTFHRLTKARDNEAQYEIRYTYWTAIAPRVKEIKEYSGAVGSETAGTIMRGYKPGATATRFRYCGADNTLSTSDDLIVQYYFDHWGRTINVVAFDVDDTMDRNPKNMLGVSVGEYKQNNGVDKDNNHMTHAAARGMQSANLLNNSGLEHATGLYGWATSGNGTAGAATTSGTSGTTEVTPRTGAYMMKLSLGSVSAGKESCYQTVYLTAGETYVFSGYVNTAAVSDTGTVGAYLSFRTSSGADITNASSRVLTYKTNIAVDDGWERLEAVFTPDQSATYQVAVNLSHMANVILADDLQLERFINTGGIDGEASASSANLIQLGGFELPTSSGASVAEVSQYWTFSMNGSNTAYTVTVEDDDDQNRGKVICLHNAPDRQVRAKQNVILNAPANRTYLVSAWGKMPVGYTSNGSDMKYNNMTYERFFGIIAKIYYVGYSTPEYQYVAFNCALDGWQYTSGMIVPKEASRTVERIELNITGDLLPNDAYVDDVTLIQEPVQTYTYNENGSLIATNNTEGQTSTELDSKDRLKKYTAMNGVVYNLTYQGDSRQPKTIVSDGITTTYTYDDAGNVTQTKTTGSNTSLYLQSSADYSADKNFQTSATDVNGSVAQSSYNSVKGLVTSTTAANGTKTYYSYNANNDRQTVNYISGVAAMHFSYNENGLLSLLARKSFSGTTPHWQAYAFSYNAWGQTEEITVQRTDSADGSGYSTGLTLASYEYADNGGNLEKMTYSNGQYVTYEYDLFDRLVREVYYTSSNTVQVEYYYIYNSEGTLAKQYAVSGGNIVEEYDFEYDSLGRLIRSRELNAAGTVKQRTEHLYDEANRLTQQSWTLGTDSFTETYTYNSGDGSLNTVTTTQIGSSANSYDSLKRLNKQIYATKTGVNYSRWYTYADNGNVASSRVASFAYRSGSTSTGALLAGSSYSYNTDGTISAITDLSSGTQVTYTYDVQGQLTDEYRYNSAGTLQSHDHYLYDTSGNLRETVQNNVTASVYSYDNAQWQDLLTAYNGVEIGYEGQTYNWSTGSFSGDVISGNPINWYNGQGYYELTWSQGRRLTYLEVFGADQQYRIDYAYDMEGIRTQKTVEAVTHYYVTQNGKVVQEICGTNVLQFVYDNNGSPYAMRYSTDSGSSWRTYYYVLNLQGDVVALIYADGTVCATYSYDAWGAILSATTTSASAVSNLAQINPLRYRGYYYDTETGWYYLQSRYYDPIVKRFINSDTYSSTGTGFLGYNMFAYCENNPVNNQDPTGEILITTLILIGAAVVGAGVTVYTGVKAREAGCGWGETILHSAINGMMAFCAVYSFGMTAYGCYQDLCYLSGRTPVTEIGSNNIATAATTGTPYEIGRAGENLAGIDQNAKTPIEINGRTRIPDALTDNSLIEVKNVKYISNTLQLRDFSDYAHATGRSLELYVRPTTRIAKTVIQAGWNIHALW